MPNLPKITALSAPFLYHHPCLAVADLNNRAYPSSGKISTLGA